MWALSVRRRVWGRLVYVSALRLDNGELLIVVSSGFFQTAICDYGKRWEFETLFGMLKSAPRQMMMGYSEHSCRSFGFLSS